MAIRVICPGCMTSFEVDDRFAGKKGPCPKCGHIIEIPKEKVVIHAPDEVTAGGKTIRMTGHDAKPILQRRFAFTGMQVFLGSLGAIVVLALAFILGRFCPPTVCAIVGLIGLFLIAFPIADFGYMLIRDDNDLEMFLGNERHKRAFFASLVFAASWIIFEVFVHFLGQSGVIACFYLIPIAAIGAFGALIFFDCNFGKALLVYLIFAFAAIVARGGLLAPNGWIWKDPVYVATSEEVKESGAEAAISTETQTDAQESESDESAEETVEVAPVKQEEKKPAKLSKAPPKVDPTKKRRR